MRLETTNEQRTLFYTVSFVRCAYDIPAVFFHNLRLKILGKLPIFFSNFLHLRQSSDCVWTNFLNLWRIHRRINWFLNIVLSILSGNFQRVFSEILPISSWILFCLTILKVYCKFFVNSLSLCLFEVDRGRDKISVEKEGRQETNEYVIYHCYYYRCACYDKHRSKSFL